MNTEPTTNDEPAIPDELWGIQGETGHLWGGNPKDSYCVYAKWSQARADAPVSGYLMGTPTLIGVSPARLAAAEARAERAEAERDKLKAVLDRQQHEISQTLGRALGYPLYSDDQKNFPRSVDADGVCVGPNTAESLASEIAERLVKVRGQRTAFNLALTKAEAERDKARAEVEKLIEMWGREIFPHCEQWYVRRSRPDNTGLGPFPTREAAVRAAAGIAEGGGV